MKSESASYSHCIRYRPRIHFAQWWARTPRYAFFLRTCNKHWQFVNMWKKKKRECQAKVRASMWARASARRMIMAIEFGRWRSTTIGKGADTTTKRSYTPPNWNTAKYSIFWTRTRLISSKGRWAWWLRKSAATTSGRVNKWKRQTHTHTVNCSIHVDNGGGVCLGFRFSSGPQLC